MIGETIFVEHSMRRSPHSLLICLGKSAIQLTACNRFYCSTTCRRKKAVHQNRHSSLNLEERLSRKIHLKAAIKAQKEQQLLHAISGLKDRFGKNSVLRGMSLQEDATAMIRNTLVGGHSGG